jgi:hypothetical protein
VETFALIIIPLRAKCSLQRKPIETVFAAYRPANLYKRNKREKDAIE